MLTKMRKYLPLLVLCVLITALLVQSVSPALAANDTVAVNFAAYGGSPTYRASGFIYGLSADASTPPQTYLSQINTRFIRAGGSQIGCPNGGWVNGQYTPRWNFVKAYYAKSRAVGATFIMILAPLWGSDGVCDVPRWPGDNGNWTEFDNFLTQVINDAKANGMTGSNVRWDIWNEPDIFFWGASRSQYLEMWKRAVQRIRSELPNAVIEGPSMSADPDTGNSWWTTYLDYIKANNVVPNIISWHSLPGDPVDGANIMNSMLSSRGISVSGYSINEYGAFGDEQQPGPSAWYIARLERANGGVDGARANWGMVGQTPSLHDTLGWLVTAAPANQPMGQWWVYKRYADQTGLRTDVTPGSTHDALAFQDSSAQKSIILIGNKAGGGTGTVTVQLNDIPSWLRPNGTVQVLVERMPSTNAYVSAPTVVSNSSMTVSGSSLSVAINWNNALDAYVVTLTPGSSGGSTPPPSGYVRLQNRNSGKCVDVEGVSTANGANIFQWTCGSTGNQQWLMEDMGGGYVRLKAQHSGKCADVWNWSTADGGEIRQYTCTSGTNQQWTVEDMGGGYFRLRNRYSGKCMDDWEWNTADGADIRQYTCNDYNVQQFRQY
ncbi:MAG: RICIN domain-containing protein [Anaerolineae bacterium]|nr:RICIN domain-containing protein [Anaerolineae bacterium]